MQKRIGSGQVFPNALVSQEAKRRKVLRSVWKLSEQQSQTDLVTVKSAQSLPIRLRTAQSFDYLGSSQRIYADLIYSTTSFQLVRFVNGPHCSTIYTMLSKATKALQDSTAATIQWQLKQDEAWIPLNRPNLPNSISREQAVAVQNRESVPQVEQALALEPSPTQVSALPFTRKPHFRNLSRRLLASCPSRRLAELGYFRNGKASEKFSLCYRTEQAAIHIQLSGVCMLCQARPIDARYPCYHCVSCTGCSRWKSCPICDAF
jgi:hypothetical protein